MPWTLLKLKPSGNLRFNNMAVDYTVNVWIKLWPCKRPLTRNQVAFFLPVLQNVVQRDALNGAFAATNYVAVRTTLHPEILSPLFE